MMRTVRSGALLVLMAFGLSGCLFNSPSNVTKRFVGAIRGLKWAKMEKLVDWKSSEQALGRPLSENRKDLLVKVAEAVTDYDIGYQGEELSRTKLLYLRVAKAKVSRQGDDRATVRATVSMGADYETEIVFATARVGRTWRVVLTPDLVKERR